jgi:mono/diheme cytochrome c family protein
MVLTLVAAAVVALTAVAAIVSFGLYNISATDQHLAPTYWLLDVAMRRSVARRAASIEVPPLTDEKLTQRGAALFDRHCRQCHGAPGVAPDAFSLGMTPVAANLAHTSRHWPPADLYWTIRYGIKMTGMPAWEYRLPDEDLWAIVAFLLRLPLLTPEQYATSIKSIKLGDPPDVAAQTADATRGKEAIEQYACITCHQIPGIVGANAPVGPSLAGIAERSFIAGRLPNTHANMVAWLRAPQAVNPGSAMPDLGLTERDAADIAAYLATLR